MTGFIVALACWESVFAIDIVCCFACANNLDGKLWNWFYPPQGVDL